MANDKTYNVLFLCTGNSCRSIMAEAIINRLGQGKFQGFSAGSHPTGEVNPYAIDILKSFNHPTDGFSSKSWDDFLADGAPHMDFVFTVCDDANETCPIFPGQHLKAHWGFPDPAAFEGNEAEKRALFADVYGQISNRIDIFCNLPFEALDRMALQKRLDSMSSSSRDMEAAS